MALKLAGRASIHGMDGAFAYTAVAAIHGSASLSTTENEVQSINLTDDFDVSELMDRRGELIGMAARNRRLTITVELVITAASDGTQSAANAAANVVLPEKLGLVTLSSFGITLLDGTWNYVGGGSVGLTPEGFLRMTLHLRRNLVGATEAGLAPLTPI